MRFIVRATFPLEAANAQMLDPKFGEVLERVIEEIAPEAYYFAIEGGDRQIYFIVKVEGSADLPRIAERLWFACDARVEFIPAISPEDMEKAMPDLEQIVTTYGPLKQSS